MAAGFVKRGYGWFAERRGAVPEATSPSNVRNRV
jgi:hypothetical protein